MSEKSDKPLPTQTGTPEEASSLFDRIRNLVRRLKGRNGTTLRDSLEDLIEQEEVAEGPPFQPDELALLRNIFNLRNLTADDISVPRADIVAVEQDTGLAELIKLTSKAAHSRMPIYRETLDDTIGMVHIKDVFAWWKSEKSFRLSNILRPVLFVAPSMPILELLLQMRAARIHMALVVDEFGGIDGLTTIEDVVEEIVGEIEDEHDAIEVPMVVERRDGSIDADARLSTEAFEDRVGQVLTAEDREEDIATLGGLVFWIAGRVPGRGEVIRHSSGIEFEILDADPRRIKRLHIMNLPSPESNE